MPTTIFQELELALLKKELEQNAMHQTGLHSTGNLSLEMEEKSKIPKRDSLKDKSQDQIKSLSDLDKVSTVSILLSQNFTLEIMLL
jgi:hypothetical protein